jgi:hypothetical protein
VERDPPRAAGDRDDPKTYSRWLRITLLSNGVRDDVPLEDAHVIANILVAQKKAIPPHLWVDDMRAEAEDAALGSFVRWGG